MAMKTGMHDIGVCSWSLRAGNTPAMIAAVRGLGLTHCQLALAPLAAMEGEIWRGDVEMIRQSGLSLPAGMISFPGEDYSSIAAIRRSGGLVPDADWPRRRDIAERAVPIAQALAIRKISTHVGFIPPSNHEQYPVILERVGEIARLFADAGLDLLMETGQEPASELLQFLHDLPCQNVGVNFDPANMILYGAGDPIEAIHILGEYISHVHVKDAVASNQPGVEWGRETVFGSGQVDPKQFLQALDAIGYAGPLTIEREGRASDHMGDIRAAIKILREA